MPIIGRFVPSMTFGQPGVLDVGWFEDSEVFNFGTDKDVKLKFDGTDFILDAGTARVLITNTALTTDVLDFGTSTQTQGIIVDIPNADSLTTGKILNLVSNSSSNGTRDLVFIKNTNTGSTGTTVFHIEQNSAQIAAYIDQNANSTGLKIDCSATSANSLLFTAVGQTSASVIHLPNADSLTSGTGFYLASNSSDVTARKILWIVNDHVSATGAVTALFVQDSTGYCVSIDHNGLTGVGLYIDRDSNAASKTWAMQVDSDNAGAGGVGGIDLSSMSTGEAVFKFVAQAITVAGTLSGQVAIDIGGTVYYIPYYTTGS